MCNSNTAKLKRIAAGIIGVVMLIIVLSSAFLIAAEADHDCTGEDCPICACIQQCENILHGFGDGTAAQLSAIIPVLFILHNVTLFAVVLPQETLISRKVRLNN